MGKHKIFAAVRCDGTKTFDLPFPEPWQPGRKIFTRNPPRSRNYNLVQPPTHVLVFTSPNQTRAPHLCTHAAGLPSPVLATTAVHIASLKHTMLTPLSPTNIRLNSCLRHSQTNPAKHKRVVFSKDGTCPHHAYRVLFPVLVTHIMSFSMSLWVTSCPLCM